MIWCIILEKIFWRCSHLYPLLHCESHNAIDFIAQNIKYYIVVFYSVAGRRLRAELTTHISQIEKHPLLVVESRYARADIYDFWRLGQRETSFQRFVTFSIDDLFCIEFRTCCNVVLSCASMFVSFVLAPGLVALFFWIDSSPFTLLWFLYWLHRCLVFMLRPLRFV